MADRTIFINGLRELADWYEAHQDVPAPAPVTMNIVSLDTKEEAAMLVRALGRCDKDYADSGYLLIKRKFGPVLLQAIFYRESVCVRRVVGTKEIPEQVIPAKPEEIIPARTEEIVQWDCEPILKPTTAETEAA